MIQWNLNGWSANTRDSKKAILQTFDADIISLCETHMTGNDKIDLDNYKCFVHNRQYRHYNLNRTFGGVQVLVKNHVLNFYDVTITDKSYDGIICLKFVNKVSGYCFYVLSCYLPPSNSVWGRDGVAFYNHLLALLYSYSDADAIYIMGDLNSRFGNESETIEYVDSMLPERKIIDKNKNKHGELLLDFLKDSQSCVVNGRINAEMDNFTYIEPSRGCSVVDFVIVPHANLVNVEYFKVHTPLDLMHSIYNYDKCVSDHSVLEFVLSPHHSQGDVMPECNEDIGVVVNETDNTQYKNRYYTRYNVNDLTDQFLQSEIAQNEILLCIERIERNMNNQIEVDRLYDQFCKIYYDEMDKSLRYKKVNNKAKKRFQKHKPYWNENLTTLWYSVREYENQFLKAPQNSALKRQLQQKFYNARKVFDNVYRKTKRKYQENKINDIETLNTEDPKAFWQELKKLGPHQSSDIPLAVYNRDGSVCYEERVVLDKWKNDFSLLYNSEPTPGAFDDNFYHRIINEKGQLELSADSNLSLNAEISEHEVRKAVNKAKMNKAVGYDNIPNEVIKNDSSIKILHALFVGIFKSGLIPSIWKKAVIKPIPKGAATDPKVPMQYRAISLLSTVGKVYSSILNNRLLIFAERNILHDEQNGFRPNRSCLDHIFSLTTILRNRINEGKQTFVSYIDAEKAFDRVDRDLLFYKLLRHGVNGNFYRNLVSMYSSCMSAINLNGRLTDWFGVNYGVRQGDTLSPTLFSIFVNDLVDDVKSLELGVPVNEMKISILLYADDVVLLADNESDLQKMLDKVSDWGDKWRIRFNNSKSKVVHYRKRQKPCTDSIFTLNNQAIEIVPQYKYLGAVLDQFLNYKVTAEILADAGGRALGAVLTKYRKLNGMGFNSFQKLFHSCVCPILDYASGVWGFKSYDKIDHIQNRAIRIFLGVHNFAPNLAIQGDMGWTHSSVRRKINMIRLWNSLIKMDGNRLTKNVFLWDKAKSTNGWAGEIRGILGELDMQHAYNNLSPVSIERAWALLHEAKCHEWKNSLSNFPKLRTLTTFKDSFKTEPYVSINMNRKYRSVIAQLRSGILPLEIETGRWKGTELNNRICQLCSSGCVEDEAHFLFTCDFYAEERLSFIQQYCTDLNDLDTSQKFVTVMGENNILALGKYVWKIYEKRKSKLFG